MLPEELENDLREQGFKIKDFSLERGRGSKNLARLKVKAQRGLLDLNDRRTIKQVIEFNIPGIELHMSPTGPGVFNSVIFSWVL